MEKKYKILKDDPIKRGNQTFYRIEALKDFGNVEKGDWGGLIEKEENLSQKGNCWIYADAIVCDDAKVYGNAIVYHSIISFNTEVYENAEVHYTYTDGPNIKIYGNAKLLGGDEIIRITEDTDIYGDVTIHGYAFIGNAELFGHLMIASTSIMGFDSEHNKLERRISIGPDKLLSLQDANISGEAKIHKDYHYGSIRGFGAGGTIEFYKTHDDDIFVCYDSRYPIPLHEFDFIVSSIRGNRDSLIEIIKGTINE